ncbi:retrovirus-related pol polyprotein from transposon TNT 1-94 [Tanacetum coccineum]
MAEDGKLKIDSMMVMISNSKGHFQNQCLKLVASRDKVVNMAAGDYDVALVCYVKNTVKDRIMDSGALFHATYCKEELERFKLRSDKVRLADDKTLDIAGIGDVVLKTSFGTSWTLKDVRYIPGLKRRLISVGQLDEEGYHIGFEDQQWKVIKGGLVVVRRNKRGSLYMVEVHPEGIGVIIEGNGSAALYLLLQARWYGDAEEAFLHNVREGKETVEVGATGVAERCLREAMKCTFIGNDSDEMRYSFRDTKSHQVIRSRDITFVDSIYGAKSATDSSSLTKPIQKSQVVLVDIPENLAENDNIVAEHGLKELLQGGRLRDFTGTKMHQRVQGSSKKAILDKAMVSLEKNHAVFLSQNTYQQERRHPPPPLRGHSTSLARAGARARTRQRKGTKEPSYVGALNDTSTQHKSEGFQLAGQEENLECRLKEIMYGLIQAPRLRYLKFDSFMQKDKMKDRCSEKQVLGYVLTVGVTTVEWESRLQKSITIFLDEEPCIDFHQVGDEREVEALRSFNWPPSKFITEDGVLPERGYSQFYDVSLGYLMAQPQVDPDSTIAQAEQITPFI